MTIENRMLKEYLFSLQLNHTGEEQMSEGGGYIK